MIHQHKIHKLVANGFKIVACEYSKKVISKTVSVEVSKVASIQDVVFRVVTLYSHVCGYIIGMFFLHLCYFLFLFILLIQIF